MQNSITDIIIFLIAGLGAGTVSGLLGVGGGVIFIPILLNFLNTPPDHFFQSVAATSLFAGVFSSASASGQHLWKGNVLRKQTLWLAIGIIPTILLLKDVVTRTDGLTMKIIMASAIFIALILLNVKGLIRKPDKPSDNLLLLVAGGFVISAIALFTGLGGGVFIVPLLSIIGGLDMQKSVGTSSLVVGIIMLFSSLGLFYNDISNGTEIIRVWEGLTLGAGAVLGAFIGVRINSGLSNVMIKKIFSVFLVLVIINIILK